MRLHRFIVEGLILSGSGGLTIAGEPAHQMKGVLKLKPGERVAICDGQGNEVEAVIHEYVPDAVVLRVEELRKVIEEGRRIILYAAIIKNENFDLLCGKASELGVFNVVPILSERTVKTNIRTDRLERIMREAAETAGRGTTPKISSTQEFRFAIANAPGVKVFYDITASAKRPDVPKDSVVSLFVGPEGGWTDAEREFAKKNGAVIKSLLPRPVRAETAAIIAVFDALHF
jgi:16S rRNA (uracil1498-N3)-methyltransferase